MDKEYTKITKMIDDYVDNLDKPIKFIYGGITEQPHKERHKQHRLEDTNYKGTKIKLITWRKNHTKELIKDVETYLIYKLRQKYPTQTYNKTSQGGGGMQYNTADLYNFYIIYK